MARDLVWTDKNLKTFWDYYSDKEEEYFTEVFGDVIVKSFYQYLNNDPICVDYGCGTGGLVKALVSVGIKTIGIDYNQKSINNIKEKYERYPSFNGAYAVEELRKEKTNKIEANIVFSIETIEHVLSNNLNEYFLSIKNIMTDNSLLIISCPNDEDIESSKVYCPESDLTFHPMQHVRSLNKKTLKEIVEPQGFKLIETFSTDLRAHFSYSKKNYLKSKVRLIKSILLNYDLYQPHLFGIFKKI